MSDSKISDLPLLSAQVPNTLQNTDIVHIVRPGAPNINIQATVADLPGGGGGTTGAWNYEAEVNATSGSSVVLASGLSGLNEMIIFGRNHTNSGSPLTVELGDSGGFEVSGYIFDTSFVNSGGTVNTSNSTDGFNIDVITYTAMAMRLTLQDSATNEWRCEGILSTSGGDTNQNMIGFKNLSAELTQVRITLSSGAFTSGNYRVLWR